MQVPDRVSTIILAEDPSVNPSFNFKKVSPYQDIVL